MTPQNMKIEQKTTCDNDQIGLRRIPSSKHYKILIEAIASLGD